MEHVAVLSLEIEPIGGPIAVITSPNPSPPLTPKESVPTLLKAVLHVAPQEIIS